LDTICRQITTSAADAESARVKASELSEKRKAAFAAIESKQSAVRERSQSLSQARTAREASDRKRVELTSRRDALVRLEESRAGFSEGVRHLSAAIETGQIQGVATAKTVLDVARFDAADRAPLLALLQDRVEALLLEDENALAAVMTWMENRRPEPVWLALIHSPRIQWQDSLRPESALHRIQVEEAHRPLWNALLGNAYIVEDLPAARALKAELPHAEIATRSGHRIGSDGLLHAFASAPKSAPLDRRDEIASLEKAITQIQSEIASLSANEADATRLRDEADWAVEEARQQARATEQEWNASDRDWHILDRASRESISRKAAIEAEIQSIQAADKASQDRHAGQLARREEAITSARRCEEDLSVSRAALPASEELEARLSRESTEARIHLASLEEKSSSLQAQLQPLEARLGDLRRSITFYKETITTNLQQASELDEKIASNNRDLVRHRDASTQIEHAFQEAQERRQALLRELEAQEASLHQLRTKHTSLHDERGRDEVHSARLEIELTNLRERISRAYGISLDQLDQHDESEAIETDPSSPQDPSAPPSLNWEAMALRVEELQQRLDQMGPVNLEAITEYDELEARHKFLTDQENDLLTAKAQLVEAITKINKTTQKLFAETFEQVRVNFQTTFTELFGGGKANLVLLDAANPLECGIDIIAKPPGKQPQSITLLSGGERTLTAVSLLFAIYMVKPSPFCVLDELDAPLDETNITRFLGMLDRFVCQSQFLLITHNKRTIAMADALYGITQEERGVSKTVSVRFNQREIIRTPRVKKQEPTAETAAPVEEELRIELPEDIELRDMPTPPPAEQAISPEETLPATEMDEPPPSQPSAPEDALTQDPDPSVEPPPASAPEQTSASTNEKDEP